MEHRPELSYIDQGSMERTIDVTAWSTDGEAPRRQLDPFRESLVKAIIVGPKESGNSPTLNQASVTNLQS